MNDTKVLLERIAAFRQRLSQPIRSGVKTEPRRKSAEPEDNHSGGGLQPSEQNRLVVPAKEDIGPSVAPAAGNLHELSEDEIPEAFPVDDLSTESKSESEERLSRLPAGGEMVTPPMPTVFTSRVHRLLREAQALIAWQRKFISDPVYAGLATKAQNPANPELTDVLVAYHQESVTMLDSAIRLVQAFPESPNVQQKLCDGLESMLEVVKQRHAVQERLIEQRKSEIHRVDRLAAVYTALHQRRAVTLKPVAALAEELLEDVRQSRPMRFLHVDPDSTLGYLGGMSFPAPARYAAARAINTAMVVARMVGLDYEWASRPLLPVVAALLKDCGMLRVPADLLAQRDPWQPSDRRLLEEHPRQGADLVLVYLGESAPLAEAIATHHERLDGSGYPIGLKGNDIKPLARLLAVADTYAGLSTDRPDRPARDSRTALTETLLLAEQGILDKDFCEYLLSLTFYPVGTVVELHDGRIGVVAANHPNRLDPRASARPVLAILTQTDGNWLSRPEHLDLSTSQRGGIVRVLSREERRRKLSLRYPELV